MQQMKHLGLYVSLLHNAKNTNALHLHGFAWYLVWDAKGIGCNHCACVYVSVYIHTQDGSVIVNVMIVQWVDANYNSTFLPDWENNYLVTQHVF